MTVPLCDPTPQRSAVPARFPTTNALFTSVSALASFTGNNPGNPQNNNRIDGYDAAGNMTYDGAHYYFYDAENRLIQVDGTLGTCSSAAVCYIYDANGRRVRRVVSGGWRTQSSLRVAYPLRFFKGWDTLGSEGWRRPKVAKTAVGAAPLVFSVDADLLCFRYLATDSTHSPVKLHSITPNDAQSGTTTPSADSPQRHAQPTRTQAFLLIRNGERPET